MHVQVYHTAPDQPPCESLLKTSGESAGDECDKPSGVDGGSPVPYQIGETDLLTFTQEESLLFFLKKQAGEQSQVETMVEPMRAASPDQFADPDIGYPAPLLHCSRQLLERASQPCSPVQAVQSAG